MNNDVVSIIYANGCVGSHKLGSLVDIDERDITTILNVSPDNLIDEKVENEWSFRVFFEDHTSAKCCIWDYKGSHHHGRFSFWCDREDRAKEIFRKIFFDHVV